MKCHHRHRHIPRFNEADVFKKLIKKEEIIKELKGKNFNMAFFDTWNLGALLFFNELKIENIFGINNIQLDAFQLKYGLSEKKKLVEYFLGKKKFPEMFKNIPEIYSATFGDSKLINGRKKKIINRYKFEISDFEYSYNFLDGNIIELYKKVKAIFLNSFELIDFPLQEFYKTANVFYVGGIHLNELKEEIETQSKNNHQTSQVIMSIADCVLLFDEENIVIWNKFEEAFDQILKDKFKLVYDCDLTEEKKKKKKKKK
ncbi:hypothetical protein Mgra_00007950 [Meloidogyne graminicola]|uniref:Uncharacterized protein n=1 Tax=Meloidogyne graminicola TaxID=189291 RepID=A0A8S9ZH83_9BILA|nr:hypothetical protein Mgra_00007950 [Meloidogyne graminicola]